MRGGGGGGRLATGKSVMPTGWGCNSQCFIDESDVFLWQAFTFGPMS